MTRTRFPLEFIDVSATLSNSTVSYWSEVEYFMTGSMKSLPNWLLSLATLEKGGKSMSPCPRGSIVASDARGGHWKFVPLEEAFRTQLLWFKYGLFILVLSDARPPILLHVAKLC